MTIFNGGVREGVATLLIYAFAANLESTPIVTGMKLRKVDDGRFGLEAIAAIPKIVAGDGSVLDFGFTTKRRLESNGTEQHYAMARCPDGHLNTRMTFVFSDGTRLVAGSVRSCSPKPVA
jgi:hypothetical protein